VIEDRELFVCRPGNLVDVGGILVIERSLFFTFESECRMFSLFERLCFSVKDLVFKLKKSSATRPNFWIENDWASHDVLVLEDEDNDDDLWKRQNKS
jgi:hypothetical protein